jgi:hypothetical protein
VIGGQAALACTEPGCNCRIKMVLIRVPVLLDGVLFFQHELP